MFGPHGLQPGDLPRRSCVSPVGVVRSAAMLTTAAFGAGSSGRFGATGSGLRMSLMGRPLPAGNVSYPVAQVGGQLSGGEIAKPTGAGRPNPVGHDAGSGVAGRPARRKIGVMPCSMSPKASSSARVSARRQRRRDIAPHGLQPAACCPPSRPCAATMSRKIGRSWIRRSRSAASVSSVARAWTSANAWSSRAAARASPRDSSTR